MSGSILTASHLTGMQGNPGLRIQLPSPTTNGVKAKFLKTEKQLRREADWKAAYKTQVHEMMEWGSMKKLAWWPQTPSQ